MYSICIYTWIWLELNLWNALLTLQTQVIALHSYICSCEKSRAPREHENNKLILVKTQTLHVLWDLVISVLTSTGYQSEKLFPSLPVDVTADIWVAAPTLLFVMCYFTHLVCVEQQKACECLISVSWSLTEAICLVSLQGSFSFSSAKLQQHVYEAITRIFKKHGEYATLM